MSRYETLISDAPFACDGCDMTRTYERGYCADCEEATGSYARPDLSHEADEVIYNEADYRYELERDVA